MKKIGLYIFALTVICLASCVSLDDAFVPNNHNGKKLEIMASVADFSKVNVNTKALEADESRVNELTMYVFGYDATVDDNNDHNDVDSLIVGKPIHLTGENSVFMIDTQGGVLIDENNTPISMGTDQNKLKSCSIYMVANCWETLKNETINTLADLKAVDIPISGIDIPRTGMPMMGFKEGFDLRKNRDANAATVADIVMDKLLAKINVRFQINANQVIHTPSFSLTEWIVNNVPTAVRLGKPAEATPAEETAHANDETMLTVDGGNVVSDGRTTIMHSESATNPDYFQITFYVPEHRVNPDPTTMKDFKDKLRSGNGNKDNAVPESDWQRFKPKFCASSQKPMYVTVNGAYTDHQGQVSNVTYSLYLGQNNTDDFHINRNQQLNNYITILGLTNNKDAAESEYDFNISVDHRVDVEDSGYSIAIERETLLDSHFEFRPMDITVSAGDRVVVKVNNPETNKWLRMEESGSTDAHIPGVGIRKYFTTDLVTNILANSTSIEVKAEDNEPKKSRIWLYFDENTNFYDKTVENSQMHRDISVTVEYYKKGNTSSIPTSANVFTFRQMNLWRLWTYKKDANNNDVKDRFYDIEYHEEYLYNYASDENYGKRKDGMVWGLDGVEFSGNMGNDMRTKAVVIDASGSSWERVIEYVISTESPYYDFYLPREAENIDASLVNNDNKYAGRRFTNAIIDADVDQNGSYSAINLIKRELDEDPESAIEYCLNKNRRNSTGTVNKADRGWYLPAIDEIEEIMVAGYTDFEVFQNKMYWSCQTAYYRNYLHYVAISGDTDYGGAYFNENTRYARATNALYLGVDNSGHDKYTYAGSAIINNGYYQYLSVNVTDLIGSPDLTTINNQHTFSFRTGPFGWQTKYEQITLYQAQYDTGYDSRGSQINRVRCVRNSGTLADANRN